MDPLSQGLFGAVASCAASKSKRIKPAFFCGFFSAASADLDVLIKSANDPMLAIEFHRHFTHSIFFIPIGGLIMASLFLLLFKILKKEISFKEIYLYCTLGYATHGLLDSFTSYGTLLFWPFYNERVAFDIISIVDLAFTLPLLILLAIGFHKKSRKICISALIYSLFYLSVAQIQQIRVTNEIEKIARNQGHEIEKLKLNPTLSNIILWRTVYEFNNNYYVNAIYMPFFAEAKTYSGHKVNKINLDNLLAEFPENSAITQDIQRFNIFSQGFIYFYPQEENIIADLRYGILPNGINSLWGIKINKEKPEVHSEYIFLRKFSQDKVKTFSKMLTGKEVETSSFN